MALSSLTSLRSFSFLSEMGMEAGERGSFLFSVELVQSIPMAVKVFFQSNKIF